MQKRFTILTILLLFLLFSYTAYAEETEYKSKLYDNYVMSGEFVTVSNTAFQFLLSSSNKEKISVSGNNTAVVIEKGHCEILLSLEICFDGTNISHHDYALDKDFYKAAVRIYTFLANVEIAKREATKTHLYIGEETTISTTIKNIGSSAASNIRMAEYVPEDFQIVGFSGCSLAQNNLLLEGTLSIGSSTTCTYTLKALKNTSFSSKAELSYFDGKQEIKSSSGSITITVPSLPLEVEFNLTNKNPSPKERFSLYVTLRNKDIENSLRILFFEMEIPFGLKVTGFPSRMKINNNKYTWSGIIEKAESITFNFELMLEYTGSYNLMPVVAYVLAGKRYENKFSAQIPEQIPIVIEEEKKIEVGFVQQTENNTIQVTDSPVNDTVKYAENITETYSNISFKNESDKGEPEVIREALSPKKSGGIIKPAIFGLIIIAAFFMAVHKRKKKSIEEAVDVARKKLHKELEKERVKSARESYTEDKPIKSKREKRPDAEELIKTGDEIEEKEEDVVAEKPRKVSAEEIDSDLSNEFRF